MPRQGVEVDNPADEQAEWRSSCTLTTADAAELVSAQMTTGYSGKQLVEKLGIKSWDRVKTRNAPANYLKLLGPLPKDVQLSARLRRPVDVVHIFSIARTNLQAELRGAIEDIEQDGAIWVSWPKKSSGVRTDLTEDAIREVALPLGLVDVKVAAVDETWSALKLVIRKSLRKN